jgi:succinate-acetate transporter protein
MNSESRSVATTTVGYMCFALAGWMISMTNAAWFSKFYVHGQALLYPLAIILGVMGILTFIQSRALDAIVFFGGAGLFGAYYLVQANTASMADPHSYVGWSALVWSVFFCYVWLGSFRSGALRALFLLGLWLTLLSLAIGYWGSLAGFVILGGYLGLITSLLAGATSAVEIIGHGAAADMNVEAPRTVAPRAAA